MALSMEIPLGIEWLRCANKYIENLHSYKYDKWTNSVIIEKRDDLGFEKEFDYLLLVLS